MKVEWARVHPVTSTFRCHTGSCYPGMVVVSQVQLSRMDDSPPLPADLIDNNGEAKRLKMDFQGTVSDPKYTAKKNLNESFTIMPSGLVRFFINVPEGFTRLDITVSVIWYDMSYREFLITFYVTIIPKFS